MGMANTESTSIGFRASPLVARQIFVAAEQPDVPVGPLEPLVGCWVESPDPGQLPVSLGGLLEHHLNPGTLYHAVGKDAPLGGAAGP